MWSWRINFQLIEKYSYHVLQWTRLGREIRWNIGCLNFGFVVFFVSKIECSFERKILLGYKYIRFFLLYLIIESNYRKWWDWREMSTIYECFMFGTTSMGVWWKIVYQTIVMMMILFESLDSFGGKIGHCCLIPFPSNLERERELVNDCVPYKSIHSSFKKQTSI